MVMVIGHCGCSSVADIGLDVARRTVMEGEGSLQVTVRVLCVCVCEKERW